MSIGSWIQNKIGSFISCAPSRSTVLVVHQSPTHVKTRLTNCAVKVGHHGVKAYCVGVEGIMMGVPFIF
jgi:hypothetical protein